MSSVQSSQPAVWIASAAAAALDAQASAAYPLETGGMLVGYRNGSSYVVMRVIGPGPQALHSRTRFEPDHDWQSAQLDLHYSQSRGVHRYLGDWHTHPDSVGELSWLDRRTLARIAAGPRTGEENPLMIVGGGKPRSWSWLAHAFVGRRLRLWPATTRAALWIFGEEVLRQAAKQGAGSMH